MTLRRQPVPAPPTRGELRDLVDRGVLVDLAGRPLELRTCPLCGWPSLGETCPRSLTCPHCRAPAGSPCRRPSGHDADTHAERLQAAEAEDQRRQRRRDPDLPAPWPKAR